MPLYGRRLASGMSATYRYLYRYLAGSVVNPSPAVLQAQGFARAWIARTFPRRELMRLFRKSLADD